MAVQIKYISNSGKADYTFKVMGLNKSLTITMSKYADLNNAYRRAVQILKCNGLMLIDIEESK